MSVFPRSFRGRLVLLFGLLWLATGVPTYLLVSHEHSAQLLADRRDNLQGEARAAASLIGRNLQERRREIELLARTPLYRRGALDGSDIRASLERVQDSYADYSWIGLADDTGVVRQATAGHLLGVNVRQRPWFDRGRHGAFVSNVHDAVLLARLLAPDTPGLPIRFVDFSSPVYDEAGRLRGVLAAHVHWRWAGEALRGVSADSRVHRNVQIFIVDGDGTVLYPEQRAAAAQVPVPGGQTGGARFVRWEDGRDYLTVSTPVAEPLPDSNLGWHIVIRQPKAEVLVNVRQLQAIILGLTGAGAFSFLLLAWVAARWMSQPLEHLAAVARRIERGDEEAGFASVAGSRELQRLSLALNGMAATLLQRKHALEAMNVELESKVGQRTSELVQLNDELVHLSVVLERLAREDALTGLPNRRAATARLHQEWAEFRRGKAAYALLMLDIDYFKRINDGWGHPAGDEVLRQVAALVQGSLRQTDVAGRVGGEEFMVLLPMTTLKQALGVAEKLRAAVAAATVAPVGQVSVSIGVAAVAASDANEDAAVQRADACLYRAKESGRNRVCGPEADGSTDGGAGAF